MTWIAWATQRPDQAGLYWWRARQAIYGWMPLRPEWCGKLDLMGMGYQKKQLYPYCSHWDGYQRTVPAGLEWRSAEVGDKDGDVRWPDFRVLPCPFCGATQRLQSVQGSSLGGVVITLTPHKHNRFWWACKCGMASTPHSENLVALVSAWNQRTQTDVEIEAAAAKEGQP